VRIASVHKPIDGIDGNVDWAGDSRVTAGENHVVVVHWTIKADDGNCRC